MSINLALNIAMKSLMTNSTAIGVANHNIANMNDPYYSRQLTNISATTPMDNFGGAGQIGTGSQVDAIERIRDLFLDTQIQNEMSNVGKWTELNRTYQLLSALVPEVNGSTNGLQSKIDAFYADWQKLADAAATGVSADIDAAAAVLYSDAVAFTQSMNNIAGDLKNLQLDLTTDLKTTLDNINQYAQQILSFNQEIRFATGMGQRPNDMLDKRNEALTKLAELVNIDTLSKSDGTLVVHINGHTLVNGADGVNVLTTLAGKTDTRLEDVGIIENGKTSDITAVITGGTLGGIIQSRDVIIKPYKDQLDGMASSLINVVNRIHKAGSAADTDFFLGFKADTIMVNPALQDPTLINYSLAGSNDIAEAIANLGNKVINNYITSPTLTLPDGTPATLSTKIMDLFTPPVGAGYNGKLEINAVEVQYSGTDTIATLINKINNNVKNFSIVFDINKSQFFMVGSDLFTVQEKTPNPTDPSLLAKLGWTQETVSAGPINSAPSPTVNTIQLAQPWDAVTPTYVAKYIFNTPADIGTYTSGIMTVNYKNVVYNIPWNLGAANSVAGDMAGVSATGGVTATPDTALQKYRFYSKVTTYAAGPIRADLTPFSFGDLQGNMTKVLNLPGDTRFGSVYKTIVGQVGGQLASSDSLLKGYQAALDQYNNMQTAVTHVDADQELAAAKMYQRAYDASVKLMEVIDEMLNLLINRTGTSSSSISSGG